MMRASLIFLLISASSGAYALMPPTPLYPAPPTVMYTSPVMVGNPYAQQPLILPASTAMQNQQQLMGLMAALSALANVSNPNPGSIFGVGDGYNGDSIPAGSDPGTYEYPDNFNFGSGHHGLGNIGTGLCTGANSSRSQVTKGYCGMLKSILDDPNSCAHQAMEQIFQEADSGGMGGLGQFCSSYSSIASKGNVGKELFIEQLLAALITKESGWNPSAQEKPWFKNGKPMGGKGLFQIGVDDASRHADCAGVATNIFDPKTNMTCGSCIALSYIAKDKALGQGQGDNGGSVGAAEYFGTFRTGTVGQREVHDQIAATTNKWCSTTASDPGGGAAGAGDPNGAL